MRWIVVKVMLRAERNTVSRKSLCAYGPFETQEEANSRRRHLFVDNGDLNISYEVVPLEDK